MIDVTCIAQQNQVSPARAARLGSALAGFTQRSFGEEATIHWIDIPENSGFTAGAPSTSMVVTARSNQLLDRDRRTTLLRELCDICVTETDKSAHELVLVVLDPPSHN